MEMRKTVAVAAIVGGVFLVAVPFATHLFDRTRGAENTFQTMRGLVSEPGIALARRDFGTVKAGGEQFLNDAVPGIAKQLGTTPAKLDAQLQRQFPDVATGAKRIPAYLQFVGPTIDALDADRARFEDADSLPGLNLPLTAAPWMFILLGGALAGAGAYGLRSRGSRALVPVAVLAAVAVAVPLALRIPDKAYDARAVGDIARGGLSQQGADKATEIVNVLDRFVDQVRGGLIPALAHKAGVSPSDVDAQIAHDYPAVSRFLNRWDAIAEGPNGAELAAKQEAAVDDFAKADKTPVLELPWLVIGPGALLLVLAGGALIPGGVSARRAGGRRAPAVASR
jgi:hypothetical protein